MLHQKKLANGNVLMAWETIDILGVRTPASAKEDLYEELIEVDAETNTIIIYKEAAKHFGINIKEV